MKKVILFIAVLAFSFVLQACLKEDEYVCKCIYQADPSGSNAGSADREETVVLRSVTRTSADFDCFELEDKYRSEQFEGHCLID